MKKAKNKNIEQYDEPEKAINRFSIEKCQYEKVNTKVIGTSGNGKAFILGKKIIDKDGDQHIV